MDILLYLLLLLLLYVLGFVVRFLSIKLDSWITSKKESEEEISNKQFIKKYKKDHIIYESSFDFIEEIDSLLYEIHDSPNNNYLNRNLLNLKSFLFNHIKFSQLSKIEFFEGFSLYENKLRDSKQYIDLGLIYYSCLLYEIDNHFLLYARDDWRKNFYDNTDYSKIDIQQFYDQSTNFQEAFTNFLRASKAGDLLGRDFLEEMYDRVNAFDISLSKDFENEIRIELGLDPKS